MTEQARTAEALRLSEAHLRRLVDANVIGIFFFDEAGGVTEANEAFLQLVGYSRDELVAGAVSWRAMTPPGVSPAGRSGVGRASRTPGGASPTRRPTSARTERACPSWWVPPLSTTIATAMKERRWPGWRSSST